MRRENRKAFEEKWEHWSYQDFVGKWRESFGGHEKKLLETLGIIEPPPETPESYHGNYHPIYDSQLKASGKHITNSIAS